MTDLRISRDLSLPLDLATDTIGVLAIKGSGKSYTAMVLLEQMVRAGIPVVALDPIGVFWGLRSSADGQSEGLPVVVIGGSHGDAPLEPEAGRVLADFVVEARQPTILDFSAFETKAELLRFARDFLERLYEKNRQPCHVFVDEADELCPQKPFGEETRVLRAMEVLVRRGRARGLGCTLITQRAAVLNKNVLTQVSTLILGRTTAPQDRKAVEAWVEAHGTEEQKRTLLSSLAALPTREKWVWSPDRGIFQRVEVSARQTFDSSATPKVGDVRVEPKKLAAVDLEALRTRIAGAIERANEEDPDRLRRRITALECELDEVRFDRDKVSQMLAEHSSAQAAAIRELEKKLAIAQENAGVEVPVIDDDLVNRIEQAAIAFQEGSREILYELRANAAVIRLRGEKGPTWLQPNALEEQAAREAVEKDRANHQRVMGVDHAFGPDITVLTARRPSGELIPVSPMNGGQQQNLGGSQQDSDGGFSPSLPVLTHDPPPRRQAGEPLGRALSKCERAILGVLAQQNRALTSVQIGVLSGYSSTAGGFRNALSALRGASLIVGGNDRIEITSRGVPLAGEVPKMPRPGQPLVRWWLEHRALGKCERLILYTLAHVYPNELRAEELGKATNYEPTAGGFRNSLSRLRTLQLVDGWKASRALMEGR